MVVIHRMELAFVVGTNGQFVEQRQRLLPAINCGDCCALERTESSQGEFFVGLN
jgi:hypothetical protein